jgi:hypothetical protein
LKQVFIEDYTYTQTGLIKNKGMRMVSIQGTAPATVQVFNSASTYNAEGSVLTLKYPDPIHVDGTPMTNHADADGAERGSARNSKLDGSGNL